MCVASFSSPEQKAKVSFWHHLLFYISIFSSRTTVHNSSEYGYDIGGTWKGGCVPGVPPGSAPGIRFKS